MEVDADLYVEYATVRETFSEELEQLFYYIANLRKTNNHVLVNEMLKKIITSVKKCQSQIGVYIAMMDAADNMNQISEKITMCE